MIDKIIDKEHLYDCCENMEQLYDKYYLPLMLRCDDLEFANNYLQDVLKDEQKGHSNEGFVKERSMRLDLQQNINKAIHLIQLLQMDGECSIRDLGIIVNILNGKDANFVNKTETVLINYELRDMIISAVRYALGRKTYITDETVDYIMRNKAFIDDRTRMVLIRDLEEYFKDRNSGLVSDDNCDYESWKKFAEWLNKEDLDGDNRKEN